MFTSFSLSQTGNAYTLLMYPANVQRMLVEHFIGEGISEEDIAIEEKIESSWLAEKRDRHDGACSF